ncbi:DUF11 domain-containing protein, partial [Nocardioides ferulae]|uniref:DUF11 domain-containing protein n=1 Tax=Nocardioides ferulae TaxID=2340821 RepID=UPI0013DDA3DE
TGLANTTLDATNTTGPRTIVVAFARSGVDPVPPTVTCEPFPTTWSAENRTTTCTASDAGVGLRDPADASFTISTTVPAGQESANAVATRQVCDLADNCATAEVSGAKVDRAAPRVVFTPASGAEVAPGEELTLDYTCVDGGSGVATCAGPDSSGTRLDTDTVGDHAVVVTTTDELGNEREATFHYRVVEETPPPGDDRPADLSLSGRIDPSVALAGDTVSYSLTATNRPGAGPARDVTVTSTLPAGVTFTAATPGETEPCTADGSTVTCELGAIAAGETRTATIRATVDPIPMVTDPNTAHQILEQKAEVDLRVESGTSRTGTVSCPTGYLATDGGVRLDAVDQGGDVAKTAVEQSTATEDGTGWTATLRNDNPGAALAKVTVACLARVTVTGQHAHELVTEPQAEPAVALTPGENTVDLTCPTGQTAYAPSYRFTAGSGVVRTSRATPTGWRFVVDAPAAATADFGIGCLSPRTSAAEGHVHQVGIEQRDARVTVPAGATVEETVTCADQAKGITASVSTPAGLLYRGSDPRAKIRAFRFTNPTGEALTADVGLTCVDIRTSGEPTTRRLAFSAQVGSASREANPRDNSTSTEVTAYGDGWATAPTSAVAVQRAGRSVVVAAELRCTTDCTATARLVATSRLRGTPVRSGSTLARGAAELLGGTATAVELSVGSRVAKAVASGKVRRAKLVVTSNDGASFTRTVRLSAG